MRCGKRGVGVGRWLARTVKPHNRLGYRYGGGHVLTCLFCLLTFELCLCALLSLPALPPRRAPRSRALTPMLSTRGIPGGGCNRRCAPRPAASTRLHARQAQPRHERLPKFKYKRRPGASKVALKHCMWIACGGPALGHQPQAVQRCRSGRPSDCSCELRGICSAQPCRAAVGLPGAHQSPPTSPRRRTSSRSYRASLSALLSPRS